jgi:hypothetical protein
MSSPDASSNPLSSEALGLTGRILLREAPKAISWIETLIRGQKIMVVGPPGVGKSSFIEFLRWGTPVATETSPPPTGETLVAHRVFRVKLGRDSQLELKVSSILDTSGHAGPTSSAKEIIRIKPSLLVIIASASDPFEVADGAGYSFESWLEFFVDGLSELPEKKLNKVLSNTFILVNKADLVHPDVAEEYRAKARGLLLRMLPNGKVSRQVRRIPVMSISLLDNDKHITSVNKAIEEMAKAIARNASSKA